MPFEISRHSLCYRNLLTELYASDDAEATMNQQQAHGDQFRHCRAAMCLLDLPLLHSCLHIESLCPFGRSAEINLCDALVFDFALRLSMLSVAVEPEMVDKGVKSPLRHVWFS